MLSILDTANSNGVPIIGNAFLVSSIELLDDSTIIVNFTRGIVNGERVSNYSVTGPSLITVNLAQYNNSTNSVRLYLSAPLSIGQWTVLFLSGPPNSIFSADSDSLSLPSNTEVVFDLTDKSLQGDFGSNIAQNDVSSFIPKEFRNKKVFAGILAGIAAGDSIVETQARLAFDQYSISTASANYLTTTAGDRGVQKPTKLGISDTDFRKLAITTINSKLTNDALLSILEIMYGGDAIHGFVESELEGPFQLFDKAYLDILFDRSKNFRFVVNWTDYSNPLRVTALELVSALNFAFDKNNVDAFATINQKKIRIYSKTKGVKSSVTVLGGILQPCLHFDLQVIQPFTNPLSLLAITWTVTNPSTGTVRFKPNTSVDISKLHVGDYITIVGANFPSELQGSFAITNVNYSYSPSLDVWFEIQSNYTVPS